MKALARAAFASESEPLALLHFAFRAVVADPDARLAELGLSRVHHRVMFFVAQSPQVCVAELAQTLGVSKQALHRPLQQLLRLKLIASRQAERDRRERHLSLTPAGQRLERRLSGHQRRLFRAAFRDAGPGAARGWAAVMRALTTPEA